jgi:hypothetical protein
MASSQQGVFWWHGETRSMKRMGVG